MTVLVLCTSAPFVGGGMSSKNCICTGLSLDAMIYDGLVCVRFSKYLVS